ncbi:sorbitol dehydrogenase [Clostridia bacterium]|nr:sorbitol dehydrogenase [Clostridia bacterium]
MTKTMKAAIYQGPRSFEIQDISVPQPGEGEVLIKVDYCAICGSDLHTYTKGFYIEPGQIMGHEFGGTVAAIGPDYPDPTLTVGQKVVTNPTVPCGKCSMCRKGKTNICTNALTATLAYGKPGAFAEYVLQSKGAFLYKLPDEVSTKEAALFEPLAVAIHAVKKASPSLNEKVVVFGAGTIGLMISQVLKTIGCTQVIQVDISQPRLEIARKIGVDHIINARNTADVVEDISKITGPGYYGPGGAEADIVFECAAVPETITQALKAVRHGGKIISIAISEGDCPINVTALVQKEVSLLGSYAYTDEFEEALDLAASGKIVLDELITDIFPLSEIQSAFERQLDTSASVKVVVKCTE